MSTVIAVGVTGGNGKPIYKLSGNPANAASIPRLHLHGKKHSNG